MVMERKYNKINLKINKKISRLYQNMMGRRGMDVRVLQAPKGILLHS